VALAADLSEVPCVHTIGANGRVWSIVAAGSTVYLGGTFTQITDTDGKTFTRNNLAAIDANTVHLLQDWNPNASNTNGDLKVRAMALSSDGTRLFVGAPSARWVANPTADWRLYIDTATGNATSWNAGNVMGSVWALAASANRHYVGGDFTAVAGQPRERLAAVSPPTGVLDPTWKPRAHKLDGNTSTVRALHLSADGSLVYAGGLLQPFLRLSNGQSRCDRRHNRCPQHLIPPQPGRCRIVHRRLWGERVCGHGRPLEGIESFDGTTGQLRWSAPGGHPDPRATCRQSRSGMIRYTLADTSI
jgi:hypothetical protein